MERRDLAAAISTGDLRRANADVDDERLAARRPHALGEIGEFLALGVRRADDVDALHRLPDECKRPIACGVLLFGLHLF